MRNRHPLPRDPLLDEALAHGGPIVVFDRVSLAFDDKEILREVSFTLQTGHTKVFLGASGAGKSTILRLTLGLLKPDGGRIFVNGERPRPVFVDYKDLELLSKLVSRQGKIIGRRKTGCTAASQHAVSAAIKRARYMALLPYVAD